MSSLRGDGQSRSCNAGGASRQLLVAGAAANGVPRTPVVETSPDIMKWVVETGSLEVSEIAKRLNVGEADVRGWLEKRSRISVARLEKLAAYAKRPLAVFLLDDPPPVHAMPDYRRPPFAAKITRDTALAIRFAQYLQEAAREMMESRGEDASPDTRPGATARHSPESIASRERRRMGLDGLPAKPGDPAGQFEILRNAVESLNVLVFQQRANPEEMRGLSLSYEHPCVILLNSRDPPVTRRFTLLHEYGHVLLKRGGMCAVSTNDASSGMQGIESWCNRFAAFALMPRAEFCKEYKRQGGAGGEKIGLLAAKFATSRLATAMHALDLGLGTQDVVNGALAHSDPPEKGGRTTPVRKCVEERGRRFVSLVLESRRARLISGRDALDYLDMDLAHAAELQDLLKTDP